MRLPLAFCHLHMGKYCLKSGILRRAGIDSELYFPLTGVHMANAHLIERGSVLGTLDTVVVLSPAEPIPHGLSLIHI